MVADNRKRSIYCCTGCGSRFCSYWLKDVQSVAQITALLAQTVCNNRHSCEPTGLKQRRLDTEKAGFAFEISTKIRSLMFFVSP